MSKKKSCVIFKRCVLLFLITVLFFPIFVQDYKAISEDDVKRAEEELEAARKKEEELKNLVSSLSGSISDIQGRINEIDRIINEVVGQIYELDGLISKKQQEIDEKQKQIDITVENIEVLRTAIADTETELEKARETEANQYASMKLRIQYMYENVDESVINILFSSDNMVDFLNNIEYVSEISKYDREKLTEYGETKDRIAAYLAELEDNEKALVLEEASYEKQLADLQDEKNILDIKREQQVAQKDSYNMLLNNKNNELNSLESDKKYAEEKRRLAEQEIADQEAILAQVKKEWEEFLASQEDEADAAIRKKLAEINMTGFTWPLPGYNKITSQFGMRIHPILGYPKLHDGTDISGADVNGKPIVAAYSGKVVLSQSYWGYGNCIKIDHGGGIQTLYAHCSVLLASVGQEVKAGETIALVGSTGNSTGPHLHFSLIIGGEFVNALDYMKVPK